MTDGSPAGSGWFAEFDPHRPEAAVAAIREGSSETVREWPRVAVESGVFDSNDEYYDALHDATIAATRTAVREAETADDKQLIHAVRGMDDCERVANELAERVAEWAGSLRDDAGTGVAYARAIADEKEDVDGPLRSLARRVRDLDDETAALRAHVERTTPEVAPNLSALAGPVLAARLIALAGGLKDLARKPAGTIQVLGAEEALLAHLRLPARPESAPSPRRRAVAVGDQRQHRGRDEPLNRSHR